MALATLLREVIGNDVPVRIVAYDGSAAGPPDASVSAVVRSPDALARFVARPGQLGLARAYVAGDVDLEGDLFALFSPEIADRPLHVAPAAVARLLRAAGRPALRMLPPPEEEARLSGTIHSRRRDRASVRHHYDVSNDFYRLVLGPSMTYSCAVFADPAESLEEGQANKYELVCRKLGLRPGMRLLDVGCGWGGLALHAAVRHGARVVGVTLSDEQHDWASKQVAQAGLAGRVDVRLQDYRDVTDGPFDAVSSIGMFEHVGRRRLEEYVAKLFGLLRPGGRLLNHAIGRPGRSEPSTGAERVGAATRRVAVALGARGPSRIRSAFVDRYVFPDGELHEVGTVVSMLQENGFEVRHLESLREHYGLTLRRWVANLEGAWDAAVGAAGVGRARVWRLYMAGSAVGFERHHLEVHQVLAVKPDGGRSGLVLRPSSS